VRARRVAARRARRGAGGGARGGGGGGRGGPAPRASAIRCAAGRAEPGPRLKPHHL